MFAGLADSTLSRDDGYRFMVLGRAIERVDMTVRMLLSRVGDSAVSPAWVTVLRSAGAHDTYLRTYRGVLDANRVVEFILLDRLFPRSIFYSLKLAEHSLDELLHSRGQSGRRHLRSAAAAGTGAQRTRIRPAGGAARIAGDAAGRPAEIVLRRRRSVVDAVLSRRTVGRLVGCRPARSAADQGRGRTDVAQCAFCTRPAMPTRRRRRPPTTKPGSRRDRTPGRTSSSTGSKPFRRPGRTATSITGVLR